MKKVNYMEVKNRLKEILESRGIKQSWLADRVGMTRGTMSNLVNNRYQISIEFAFVIADVLDMDVKDIWYLDKR